MYISRWSRCIQFVVLSVIRRWKYSRLGIRTRDLPLTIQTLLTNWASRADTSVRNTPPQKEVFNTGYRKKQNKSLVLQSTRNSWSQAGKNCSRPWNRTRDPLLTVWTLNNSTQPTELAMTIPEFVTFPKHMAPRTPSKLDLAEILFWVKLYFCYLRILTIYDYLIKHRINFLYRFLAV